MRTANVFPQEVRRAAPYALVLALGLGAVVVAGAHLSNAFPSERAPFGWPGPASFERGVAMVRSDLVLAASLPALLLGARALRGREPTEQRASSLVPLYAIHVAMIAIAVMVAALIGAWGAGETPRDAWWAFVVAHVVLAASFYSLAFLWACHLREHALAAAAATWVFFLGVYEAVSRTILFRTEGYHNLASGAFPDWFWAAQAFSPLSSYTGILILWRERFRDYLETETLKNATLPSWLVPGTFVGLAIVLWIALPLALGLVGWWWRGRGARTVARRVAESG